jgi:hypothetical protein
VGTLTTNRHAATVTDSLVATNLNLAADISGNLAAEIAFNFEVDINPVTKGNELLIV